MAVVLPIRSLSQDGFSTRFSWLSLNWTRPHCWLFFTPALLTSSAQLLGKGLLSDQATMETWSRPFRSLMPALLNWWRISRPVRLGSENIPQGKGYSVFTPSHFSSQISCANRLAGPGWRQHCPWGHCEPWRFHLFYFYIILTRRGQNMENQELGFFWKKFFLKELSLPLKTDW